MAALKYPDRIGSTIQRLADSGQRDRQLWELALMFLDGRQSVVHDKNKGVVDRIDLSARGGGQERVTVNLLINMYRNVVSKFAVNYPAAVVLPAGAASDEHIELAGLSEQALRYYWQSSGIEDVATEVAEWIVSCGDAALHTYYDPSEGRVRTDAVGCFDLGFEPSLSPKQSSWISLESVHEREVLLESYEAAARGNLEGLEPEWEAVIRGATRVQGDGATPSVHDGEDRVTQHTIYWRDGRHAVLVGEQYVWKAPERMDVFPVQVIRYTVIPRKLRGAGLITQLLDLQYLYNETRTLQMKNIRTMAQPKWAKARESRISNSAFTDETGEVIEYSGIGGPPHQMAGVPMPAYVEQTVTRFQAEMGDAAGIHSVSLGKRAVGIKSGRAIEALSENDVSQLQGTQRRMERAFEEMAKVALVLMKKHYTERRWIAMLDETGAYTHRALASADLLENPTVFIEAGSLFQTKAADRESRVMDLLEAQLIGPEEALDEIDYRTGFRRVAEKIKATAHARKMLLEAIDGNYVEIFLTDDIKVFVRVWGSFMRSNAYGELEQETQDYIRDVFAALAAAGQPDEAFIAAQNAMQVWPRKPETLQKGLGAMANTRSTGAMDQEADAQVDAAQSLGTLAGAEHSTTQRAEALIAGGRSSA